MGGGTGLTLRHKPDLFGPDSIEEAVRATRNRHRDRLCWRDRGRLGAGWRDWGQSIRVVWIHTGKTSDRAAKLAQLPQTRTLSRVGWPFRAICPTTAQEGHPTTPGTETGLFRVTASNDARRTSFSCPSAWR